MDNETVAFVDGLFTELLDGIEYLLSRIPPVPPMEYRDIQACAYEKGYGVALVAMEGNIKDAKARWTKRVLDDKLQKIRSFDLEKLRL